MDVCKGFESRNCAMKTNPQISIYVRHARTFVSAEQFCKDIIICALHCNVQNISTPFCTKSAILILDRRGYNILSFLYSAHMIIFLPNFFQVHMLYNMTHICFFIHKYDLWKPFALTHTEYMLFPTTRP